MLTVDIQRDSDDPAPSDAALQRAASVAIETAAVAPATPAELSLRIVERDEIRALNRRYRDRDSITNVLSFPAELPADLPFRHLGDVVICAGVVADEAAAQGIDSRAHWAHMVVHGVLHLLGHDHEEDAEAKIMEALETAALTELGFPCPYSGDDVNGCDDHDNKQNLESIA
jgi:probable rRNA maturation factor